MHPPDSPSLNRRPVVLIPAYKPEVALIRVVTELQSAPEIAGVLVIDDGSGSEFSPVFEVLRRLPRVHLLAHAVNLGKGAALKTGLNHAAVTHPESVGVVTADADGQHAPADILRVAATLAEVGAGHLVLGVRAFDTAVPLRSRFGNSLTRRIMRIVTGQAIRDTQTGLRGIPLGFIPTLLKLRPTGYDFELDMLVTCKGAGIRIQEIPISTIYLDGNRSSHFNPLRDSMRIYFVFIRFSAVSLVTALIDNGVFILGMLLGQNVAASQILSRFVAGIFQFTASRQGVFRSALPVRVALPRFCLVALVSGVLSYLLIQSILHYVSARVVPAKLLAETILFITSFVVQRDLVFSAGSRSSSTAHA